MKLYGFPASPNTWKVRAFAHHIGLAVEFQLVDLTKAEQKQPTFLAINPTGRTPALVDGDFKLWESTAILQYIGDKKPGPMWPADAKTRADIMRWQSWQLQHWSRSCSPLLFERLVKSIFNLGGPDAKIVAEAEQSFHSDAKILNAHLGKHSHLVADRLTLADFSVGSYLFYHEPCGMPLAEYGNVKRWFGALAALPCWAATAPPKM